MALVSIRLNRNGRSFSTAQTGFLWFRADEKSPEKTHLATHYGN
jgi:hypothetical protein